MLSGTSQSSLRADAVEFTPSSASFHPQPLPYYVHGLTGAQQEAHPACYAPAAEHAYLLSNNVHYRNMLPSWEWSSYGLPQPPTMPQPPMDLPVPMEVDLSDAGAFPRPHRPNIGQRGRPVRLLTNFYRMSSPDIKIYHYDVEIHPENIVAVNRKVLEAWRRMPRDPTQSHVAAAAVYDGRRNLFMPTEYPLANETTFRGKTRREEVFYVELSESVVAEAVGAHPVKRGPQRYKLRLRKVAEIDMERLHKFLDGRSLELPRETIMVLEVMLRHRPALLLQSGGTGGGFYTSDGAMRIRGGLAIHPGWYQSLRPTFGQLLLNLDISSTAFYQNGALLDIVARFFQRETIQEVSIETSRDLQRLTRFLQDVSIEITYRTTGRRRYKVKGLTPTSAVETHLTIGKSSSMQYISVAEYFKQKYDIELAHPNLPCVTSGTKNDIVIPMELCVVRPNQRHTGRLNDRQASEMVKITALLPKNRLGRIEQGKQVMHSDAALFAAWGVQLEPQMVEIEGRILPPPQLSFQPLPQPLLPGQPNLASQTSNLIGIPEFGAWKMERTRKFAAGASLRFWSVAVFGDEKDVPIETVQAFVLMLIHAMEDKGMEVYNHRPEIVYGPARSEVAATLTLAEEKARENPEAGARVLGGLSGHAEVQLVLCIISQKHTVYNDIKRVAETQMGLMTQCCMSRQVLKLEAAYVGNLILKLNTKLGGINVFVDPVKQLRCLGERTSTMIFGADVTHPPPGTIEGRSIAAVVGSVDSRFCEYRASIRIQNARQEIITDLASMASELLDLFYQRAKIYPKRIIFYRDGVSDGQFTEVALQEIANLRKALVDKGVQDARITFLVVNKRHHVRVFPVEDGLERGRVMDRKGNAMPGTVVDTGIVHPYEFDFYLTSHAGLQGTSKPAHYHVLYDENRFTADDLQELTYRLCYLYARSTRSVSIVPPAYYAHLVAARARCHAASMQSTSATGITVKEGDFNSMAEQNETPKKRVGVLEIGKVAVELQRKMYFT
ncbi:uncharacterized protein SPPG_01063 [Spizellomyces punctatus DAOM BR117]|uniref:Piwi domain-containing protein n=1 Tax=Spizellomyces punctatus (strain DAOM BR117) TaxID=645134 RepID=A0A0L0HR91_SPIPD|nr:uncharacterized protein SPPG_01063 [Spizellomyces punctatus DAOM BR117]KND03587.1 hypothetical protein SPPG_01063 [Spizellomyces punctatus DAOM BR117]|eukprot:XP_016611626.1 hypothetical protein SPPG_01063 [Spizellomyces punctatus DAOM BR117]